MRIDSNMERKYQLPVIAWLKITDYIHGWARHELGGAVRACDQRVISVQHLRRAKEVLRMETAEDMKRQQPPENTMSATKRNCIEEGMKIDREATEQIFGVTQDELRLFVPVECPKMCLTANGVLRPWTLDTCFGKKQSRELREVIFCAFWDAVAKFADEYADSMAGKRYSTKEMIEAFCNDTGTPEVYIDTIRREWLRQRK